MVIAGEQGGTSFAALGQRSAIRRLRLRRDAPGSESRSGAGWTAVRTRATDNDSNGVVCEPGAIVPDQLLTELIGWVTEEDRAASWLLERPDPPLARRLEHAGAQPERSGNWCGRALALAERRADVGSVGLVRVDDDATVAAWLDLADGCGWFPSGRDRSARESLLRESAGPVEYWVALADRDALGFASTLLDASGVFVELCDLGVRADARRRGIGRELALRLLDHAARSGATTAIAAPSPDGWALFQALGFALAPVEPDVCFYLTSPVDVGGSG